MSKKPETPEQAQEREQAEAIAKELADGFGSYKAARAAMKTINPTYSPLSPSQLAELRAMAAEAKQTLEKP